MKEELFDRVNNIAQIIHDKKGFNILALDLKGISSITDCVLIAEANVNRHAKAIVDELRTKFSEKPYRVEGLEEGEWVVIDYLDIVVHIFLPDIRHRYQLETLWKESKIIDLKLETPSSSASI
ncbi:MAG: ribosome silencing factor [Chlamydiae bacterium CG10_big_fil_rev_8_21_14_0_10_35_9]|nr:MAG: ribosome silencing factor [Chlamydiae bacterium CG10_big_fil_rev_8_21_14_0_10_35_9]